MSSTTTTNAQSSFEQIFREYASIYNGIIREGFTESEEKIVDQLFATKVCVHSNGQSLEEVGISQLKYLFQGFLQAGRKCKIVHLEFLDDCHVEYQTHVTGPNNFESMDHSIARIDPQNNKIVSIEPFSKDGTARILFQIKFREYFALYDGSPKVFGKEEEDVFRNLFAEDFGVIIDDEYYNQQQWMEAVKACIEGGMKVDILKFSFLPNSTSTFVYKLRVSTSKDEQDVFLLSVGQVKYGKFATFVPHSDKAYRSVFPSSVDSMSEQMNHCDKENAVRNHRPSGKKPLRPSASRFDEIERNLL